MSANGIQKLIIPVKHSKKESENLHDHNAKIDNSQNWKVKHWKSIQNSYRSSPFFEFYEEELSNIFLIMKSYYALQIFISFHTLAKSWG